MSARNSLKEAYNRGYREAGDDEYADLRERLQREGDSAEQRFVHDNKNTSQIDVPSDLTTAEERVIFQYGAFDRLMENGCQPEQRIQALTQRRNEIDEQVSY